MTQPIPRNISAVDSSEPEHAIETLKQIIKIMSELIQEHEKRIRALEGN